MMNMFAMTLLLTFISQVPGVGGVLPQNSGNESVTISMTAFYALNDEETEIIDVPDALKPFDSFLDSLPYNRFEVLTDASAQAERGRELHMPVSGIFSFYVTPLQTHDGGSVELDLRVEMLHDSGYLDAIRAQGLAAPNQPLVMRGFPVNRGELILIVRLESDGDGEGQSADNDSNSDEQESDEGTSQEPQEEEEQEGDENQNEQPEDSQPPQQQSQSSELDESKPDLQNVEALLEYLEEVDRREQEEIRRQRDSIEIRGDWW